MSDHEGLLRIILIVVLIVAVLVIIQSSWNIWTLNQVVGDDCACSGLSDGGVSAPTIFNIVMLVVGILLALWIVYLLLQSTCKNGEGTWVAPTIFKRGRQRFNTDEV